MSMKRSTLLFWIIGGGSAFVFFILCLAAFAFYISASSSSGFSFSTNQIASLDLEGTIDRKASCRERV